MERQRGYQRKQRFTKRLEVTFSSGPFSYRGILSDISENGLFIRTNHGFAPGTTIDIELVMPDNQISRLKGVVRRTVKTPLSTMKNGMGIELTKKDSTYINFIKSYSDERETETEKRSAPEVQIITCPSCGVKNKVSSGKLSFGPKCGRCRTPLIFSKP